MLLESMGTTAYFLHVDVAYVHFSNGCCGMRSLWAPERAVCVDGCTSSIDGGEDMPEMMQTFLRGRRRVCHRSARCC